MASTLGQTNEREKNFQAFYPGTAQKITTSGSSQQLTLQAQTSLVRLFCTKDCHIKRGTNPTAAADGTSMFLPGGIVEYVAVLPGEKIAVIQDSTGGTLFVSEGQ